MRAQAIVSAALVVALVSAPAQGQTADKLEQQLAAKDAQIAKLEKRVRELERRARVQTASVSRTPSTNAVALASGTQPGTSEPGSPADDDEAERALERTMVREGALVLAPFTFEVAPQLGFAHWDRIQETYARNSYSAAVAARMGLPWQSQLAVSLPYVVNDLRSGGYDSGLGDIGVVFSKELMRESDYGVNLVGSAGWTSPTRNGSTLTPIPYVSGFQGGVTASKRLDPLVVFGAISYFSSASRDLEPTRVRGTDVIGARMGGSLAISPSTSMTMGLNVNYVTDPGPSNLVLPRSDRFLSSIDIGVATIVGPRTLLGVTAQIGVTGHMPDFRLITSLPIRF
jgi:hypothetical protein